MAQYKVPQDVEAEDKLLGPFTFRQFIYLVIGVALLAAAWGLFQLMPLLCIIPLPVAAFFIILALPLKKDQPMEIYLAALLNFYFKPNRRLWMPGQRESTIQITAPKKVEAPRTRDLSQEEAGHRLSFLSEIVDSEGMSIRNSGPIREEYIVEASQVQDIMDHDNTYRLNQMISNNQMARYADAIRQMNTAILRTENLTAPQSPPPQPQYQPIPNPQGATPGYQPTQPTQYQPPYQPPQYQYPPQTAYPPQPQY